MIASEGGSLGGNDSGFITALFLQGHHQGVPDVTASYTNIKLHNYMYI